MNETSEDPYQRAKELFCQAVEFVDPNMADSFLAIQCAGNSAVHAMVQRLLVAHRTPDTILDSPDRHKLDQEEFDYDPPTPLNLGQCVGRYEIRQLIGEGGMGLVYRAEQLQPIPRTVALKIIKPGLDTREILSRFRIEQQALARLDHPGIARVLDAGHTDDGHSYFVMEMVEGIPLTQFCDQARLDVEARLRLFQDVCAAVAFAHLKGIIHRDLKPNNILVCSDEKSIKAKVIDFGLAKAIDGSLGDQTQITRERRIVGTPRYMSPEQADPDVSDIDTRADVYALGTMLFELLTGTTPFETNSGRFIGRGSVASGISPAEVPRPSRRFASFDGDRQTEVAMQRCEEPRRLRKCLAGDLDWILIKSLEHDREQRYESVAALSEDLTRYLHDQPIQARPRSATYQLRKFLWRHRAAAFLVSVVLGAISATTLVSINQANRAWAAQTRAERFLEQLTLSQQNTQQLLYAADLRIAAAALQRGDITEAAQLIERQRPTITAETTAPVDHRGIEWSMIHQRIDRSRQWFPVSQAALMAMALRPDGRVAATVGTDGVIHLVDSQTRKVLRQWSSKHRNASALAFSHSGDTLAMGTEQGNIELWDLTDQNDPVPADTKNFRSGSAWVRTIVFSQSGEELLVSGHAHEVQILDRLTGKPLESLVVHDGSIGSMALSADGQRLVCASNDKTVSVWDWREAKLVHRTAPTKFRLTCVDISSDGKWIAAATVKGDVQVISTDSWETVTRATLPAAAQTLAISPQCDQLAVGCRTGTIHVLPLHGNSANTENPDLVSKPQAHQTHQGRVPNVRWLDDQRLISVGNDGAIAVTTLDQDPTQTAYGAFASTVLALSRDGRWIAAHDHHRIQLIDTRSRTVRRLAGANTDFKYSAIEFLPSGDQLLVATEESGLLICDLNQPDHLQPLSVPIQADYGTLRFSRDGRRLMLHSRRSKIAFVVDYASMQTLFQTPCPDSNTSALSADGRTLAVSSFTSVSVHDVDSGRTIARSPNHHTETINDLRFGPTDGHEERWLATISDDRTIRLWNPWHASPSELIGVHPDGVPRSLAISSDGRTLLTSSRSGEVWCWNVPARQKLFTVAQASAGYLDSLLSADDSTLVTLDQLGQIRWLQITNPTPSKP